MQSEPIWIRDQRPLYASSESPAEPGPRLAGRLLDEFAALASGAPDEASGAPPLGAVLEALARHRAAPSRMPLSERLILAALAEQMGTNLRRPELADAGRALHESVSYLMGQRALAAPMPEDAAGWREWLEGLPPDAGPG